MACNLYHCSEFDAVFQMLFEWNDSLYLQKPQAQYVNWFLCSASFSERILLRYFIRAHGFLGEQIIVWKKCEEVLKKEILRHVFSVLNASCFKVLIGVKKLCFFSTSWKQKHHESSCILNTNQNWYLACEKTRSFRCNNYYGKCRPAAYWRNCYTYFRWLDLSCHCSFLRLSLTCLQVNQLKLIICIALIYLCCILPKNWHREKNQAILSPNMTPKFFEQFLQCLRIG